MAEKPNFKANFTYANIGNVKKDYIIGLAWYRIESEYGTGFIH